MASLTLTVLASAILAWPAPAAAFTPQGQDHTGHNHPPLTGDHADHPAVPAAPIGPVRLTPVRGDQVRLSSDGLLGQCFEMIRTVTLPQVLAHNETSGYVHNFELAAGQGEGERRGSLDSDAQVYRAIETAALTLITKPDAALEARIDALIEKIAAAQRADGYLNTHFQLAGQDKAWSDLANGRELYCAARLIEAATTYKKATKKTRLFDVARKFADAIDKTFGPGKRQEPPAHAGLERALSGLFEGTGEARYLTLARFFVDRRGQIDGRTGYGGIAQDARPLLQENVFLGDPLRGTAFYSGAAEVSRAMGDDALMAPLDAIWTDAVTTKMYVTGALGNANARDGITGPYDLAAAQAAPSTLGAIGLMDWSESMLLATGYAKYADVIDRALHNALLSSVALKGDAFARAGALVSDGTPLRRDDPECALEVARAIAAVPGQVFALGGNSIYVLQYVPCEADFVIGGVNVHLKMQTPWPYGGLVEIAVQADKQVTFAIKFRRPGWCQEVVYMHNLKEQEHSTVYPGTEAGWEVYDRRYDPMDGCKINHLGPIRREYPAAEVKADAGRVVIRRGPLVYAFEGVDNKGAARSIVLKPSSKLEAIHYPDPILGNMRAFRSREAQTVIVGPDGTPTTRPAQVHMVPYYQLGNRGPSDFAVWIPENPALATPAGAEPPR